MKKIFTIFAALTLCVGLWAIDEDAPENFSAEVVGTSYNSVTIKAYAEDASGEIIYTVKESGAVIATANGISGVEKTFTVTGLASGTDYSLLVLAADHTGNVADGLSLDATTLASPAVTDIAISGDLVVGSELTFTATVAHFSAEPIVVYEVKAEGGDYAQAQGGKFTPTAAGNYTVKATAFYQPDEGDAEEASKEVEFTIGTPVQGSVITYTAEEKLKEVTSDDSWGLHTNAIYAADSTLLTITDHSFSEGVGTVTLNGELAIIGDYAFFHSSLTSITIPAGVTTIGEMAFYKTSLTSVTIPASVTEIGMGAFAMCSGLASVTFESNACQDAIGEYAFEGVGEEAPALLTLPNSWTGTLPDEEGNWYGGKFEMSEIPTGWVNANVNADVNKYLHNGQMIIRKGDKLYNAVGAEL